MLSIIPLWKTEATKTCHRSLTEELDLQQRSILHALLGSTYIISALTLDTSLFSDFEPFSALLGAVLPPCPLAAECALCRAF